jgi:hypothetical protein
MLIQALAPATKPAARGRPRNRAIVPFRFLDLPRELRDKIYELVFPSDRGFVRFFNKYSPQEGKIRPTNMKINLLFSCRQIYTEALPILYKVNTFCISSLVSKEFELVHHRNVEVYHPNQNAKWLTTMPLAGRQAVLNLEMRIPAPHYDAPKMEHYDYMSDFFPKLQKLTLFADSNMETHEFGRAELEKLITFYTGFKARLPIAAVTELDLSFIDGYKNEPALVTALKKVFDIAVVHPQGETTEPSSAESKFMLQETTWCDKWHEQDDAEYEFLRPFMGDEVDNWKDSMTLDYWGLREEGCFAPEIDDDDAEEWRLFGSWSVEGGAANKHSTMTLSF